MVGNIAFDPKLIASANERVGLIPFDNDPKNSNYILVTGTGDSPFKIRFIDGAERNGQILYYQGTNQQIHNLLNANLLATTSIVGDGSTTTITVLLTSTGTLANGDVINIVNTDNFNAVDVVVAGLVTNTSFTYNLEEIGNTTPEAGTIQDGNILTADGTTLVLDGTVSTLNVPIVTLIFDVTIIAGGGWRVLSVSSGGGISEPIILGINTLTPQTSPTATPIAWDTKNPQQITIDRNITFSFTDLPSSGSYEGILVIIDIDATGGFDTPIWPSSVTNPPTVSTTASTRTSVMLYTIDGGTTVTHATSVGSSSSSVSQWATFQALADVNFATFDGINIDRLLFDKAAGSSLISTTTGITSNASGDLNFNIPTNTKYNFSSAGLSILALDNSGTELSLSLFARDDETPILQLTRIDSTPSVGAQVGRVIFAGVDSTGSTIEEFARIQVDSEDLTIGSVDASMHLQVDQNSLTTAFISLNNSNDNKISLWKNPQLQTGINFELNSNRLLMTTGASTTFIKGDATSVGVFVSDASSAKGTFGTTRLILANDYFLQSQAVELRNVTSDLSSPINGTTWYNSTLNKFRARENGVDVDMIGGAGANTALSNLITTSINQDLLPNSAATFNLGSSSLRWGNVYVGRMVFPVNTSAIAADVNIVRNTSNDMQLNVGTGNTIGFTFNGGVTQVEVSSTELRLPGVNLDLENNNITDANQIQVTGSTGDVVRGLISGAAGLLDVFADENSSAVRIGARTSGGTSQTVIQIDTDKIEVNSRPINNIFDLKFSVASGVVPVISGNINANEIVSTVGSGFGFEWRINSVQAYRMTATSFDVNDNDVIGVNNMFLTTSLGAAVGSIKGIDAATDILEVRLGAAVDFAITDNGTTRLAFNNTLLRWEFGGSSIIQLPTEGQIADRASAPSTPSSGFMSFYVINVAGAQTFKVKFDNGTEKTIATDV